MRTITKSSIALAAALCCVLVPATTANAADDPIVTPQSECSGGGPDIAVTYVSTVYVPGDFRAYGDGGAVLTISAGQSSTVNANVSVSGTVTEDAVVASASETIGVSLGVSETVSQDVSGSYTVPDGLTGQYIELGAAGRSFDWSSATYNSNCVLIDSESGSAVAPTDSPYFYKSW
jgi:hypothetical protein